MKGTSCCLLAALSALVLAGIARAESDLEYGNRPPSSESSPTPVQPSVKQAKPAPRAAPRSALFAPAAAAQARRLSVEQREERRFLKDAAASSRFEAEASRLALGKSSDPGVRSIAATLIDHHASASNELLHMLHSRGMAAPMLANDQRRILNHLAKLRGAKFDREFVEQVALKYRQEDVQQYEKASLAVKDPQLRAWIDRALPTLRDQVATAERLVPADHRRARAATVPQTAAENPLAARARTAAGASGPAPSAQSGGMPIGNYRLEGPSPLGLARPVAVWPSESSTR